MALTGTTIVNKGTGVKRIKAVLVCDGSGVIAASVAGAAFGRLVGVGYKPGTLATGVDITVTDSDTGATIFSLTDAGTTPRYFRPSAVVTTNAGVAVTAATTATNVDRDIYVAGKIKVAVAQGGAAGAGELHLIVDESIGGGL